MKRLTRLTLTVFTLLLFTFLNAEKVKISDLAPKYQKWYKDEISYIITDQERNVFLQLTTDKDRDMFIEAFWKNRDPNPHTVENEFRIEHYKRLKYADEILGRGTPTPGWRTEMGRIYIILGPPNQINTYDNMTEIYPTIIWFYQGLSKYGLPSGFNVVFFKKEGSGDYMLYSPASHGPQSLLVNYMGDVNDYIEAYKELSKVNPDIARVSMSLVEGESAAATTRPTFASDLLIQKQIPASPTKQVNSEYAEKLLKYKQYIDVDYSVNYLSSVSLARPFYSPHGHFFINYLIEPQKLSLEQYDKELHATLEINGNVLDAQDNIVYEFNKNVPIKIPVLQLEQIQQRMFSFQDYFPLIEGKYKINILLRNTASKEFASIEKEVVVPKLDKPWISPLILAHSARKTAGLASQDKPFTFGDTQLHISPRNDFMNNDTLYVCYQLLGLTPEQKTAGSIQYTLYKNDEEFRVISKKISEIPNLFEVIEEIPLTGFSAAYYDIRVALILDSPKPAALEEHPFYISPMRNLSRAWGVSLSSAANNPETYNILGRQYANTKQDVQALKLLDKAFNLNPSSPNAALDYARQLFKMNDFSKTIQIAVPFLQTDAKNNFTSLLGMAHMKLEKFDTAIDMFKQHLAYHGSNIQILNAIGECNLRLDKPEEALVAWEKSLDLMPKQDELKTLVDKLKNDIKQKKQQQ